MGTGKSRLQKTDSDFLQNVPENIRKIPEVWRMMMDKLGSVFERLPINWYKIGTFITEYFLGVTGLSNCTGMPWYRNAVLQEGSSSNTQRHFACDLLVLFIHHVLLI